MAMGPAPLTFGQAPSIPLYTGATFFLLLQQLRHRHLYFLFRHSHGGTGCGSTHNPFLASRASFSSPSRTVSPDAYLHTTKMRQP